VRVADFRNERRFVFMWLKYRRDWRGRRFNLFLAAGSSSLHLDCALLRLIPVDSASFHLGSGWGGVIRGAPAKIH
jgi:hypothetical protein